MNEIQEIKKNNFICPKCMMRFMKPFVYRENCLSCGYVPKNQALLTQEDIDRNFVNFNIRNT